MGTVPTVLYRSIMVLPKYGSIGTHVEILKESCFRKQGLIVSSKAGILKRELPQNVSYDF
jgi:hypothetical protein